MFNLCYTLTRRYKLVQSFYTSSPFIALNWAIFLSKGLTVKKPTTKAGKAAKFGKVMGEFKEGTLHSGKGGPVVKSAAQAKAIAASEAGLKKKKSKK